MPGPGVFARQLASAIAGPRVRAVMLSPRADDLRDLAARYARGALRAQLDVVLPLDELAEAHRRSIAGRARGKIVVAVR
ncbi:MAG: zinc-binding dehydrogenase [Polyangiales bacterium]